MRSLSGSASGNLIDLVKSFFFAAGLVSLTTTWIVAFAAIDAAVFVVPQTIAITVVVLYQGVPMAALFAADEYARRRGKDAQQRFRSVAIATVVAFLLLHIGGGQIERLLHTIPAGWPRSIGLIAYVAISLVSVLLIARYRTALVKPLVGPILAVGPAGIALAVFLAVALHPSETGIARYAPEIATFEPSVGVAAPAPMFVIVFDELSGPALLDSTGQIDAVRFPNFAALASRGALFTDARANYFNTHHALPALAEGLAEIGPVRTYLQYYGAEIALGDACDSAVACRGISSLAENEETSIFKHVMLSAAARLIPSPWSAATKGPLRRLATLAGVPLATTDPDGIHLFDEIHLTRFLDDLGSEDPEGAVYLFHSLASHHPYIFEPDGSISSTRVAFDHDLLNEIGFSLSRPESTTGGPLGIGSLREAYLDQIGYADQQLGRILETLKREDLFDRSTVVVTADHGIRTEFYQEAPNALNDSTTRVPLIVSAPGLEPAVIHGTTQQTDLARGLAELTQTGDGRKDANSLLTSPDVTPWFLVRGRWIYHLEEPGQWRLVGEVESSEVLERSDASCFQTLLDCRLPLVDPQ